MSVNVWVQQSSAGCTADKSKSAKVFDTALGHGRVAVGAPPPNPNPLLINLEVCLTLGINITKFHYSFVGFPYLNGFVLYILRYNNFYKVTRDYK